MNMIGALMDRIINSFTRIATELKFNWPRGEWYFEEIERGDVFKTLERMQFRVASC